MRFEKPYVNYKGMISWMEADMAGLPVAKRYRFVILLHTKPVSKDVSFIARQTFNEHHEAVEHLEKQLAADHIMSGRIYQLDTETNELTKISDISRRTITQKTYHDTPKENS